MVSYTDSLPVRILTERLQGLELKYYSLIYLFITRIASYGLEPSVLKASECF